MDTLQSCYGEDSAYWGERGHWLVVIGRHRDSDCLVNSNFDTALARLGGESATVAVERSSHWAVGWCECVIVDPSDAEKVAEAEKMRAELEDYPVLDEEDYYRRRMEKADEVLRECYTAKERIAYIRDHETDFDFRDYADMLGCVRGKRFGGDEYDFVD